MFPEGWLCANIIEAAFAFRAAWNIILGSATVPERPPCEIQLIPITLFDLLSKRIAKDSRYWRSPLSQLFRKISKQDCELEINGLSEALNFGK